MSIPDQPVQEDLPSNGSDREKHEHHARVATIKGLFVNRVMLAFTVCGVIVGIISVAISCSGSGPNPSINNGMNVSGNSNSVDAPSGTCAQVTNGSTCTVEQQLNSALQASGGDDTKLKQQLRAGSNASQPPQGNGPWPFVVVDTGTLGLFARTSDTVQATHVGYSANDSIVWVNCVTTSDFTPPDVSGDDNVGPKWAQVRWKPLPNGTDRGISEFNQTQTAWMYSGTLAPLGQNGNVHSC